MQILPLLFFANALFVFSADAVIAYCGNDPCVIDLEDNTSCVAALAEYDFFGTCCSLVDHDNEATAGEEAGCQVRVSSGECYWYKKGEDGMVCTEYDDGTLGCVPSYTQYETGSTEPCPESKYEALPFNRQTDNFPIVDNTQFPILDGQMVSEELLEAPSLPPTTSTTSPSLKPTIPIEIAIQEEVVTSSDPPAQVPLDNPTTTSPAAPSSGSPYHLGVGYNCNSLLACLLSTSITVLTLMAMA